MRKTTTLVLLTASYPYRVGAEETFLEPALEHFIFNFDRLLIVPMAGKGKRLKCSEKIEIIEDIVIERGTRNLLGKILFKLRPFTSVLFYREIFMKYPVFRNVSNLRKAMYFIAEAKDVRKWAIKFIKRNKLDLKNTIFYSYWLNATALGIAMAKSKYSDIKFVARAHGYDLYEERTSPAYIPFRIETLKNINHLFLISQDGVNYLGQKYPSFKSKYALSRLGTNEPGFLANSSDDGVFRIVSCSMVIPVKRIDLILFGLVELAKSRPDKKFEWIHIGDGFQLQQIKEKAKELMPANINCSFLGNLPNQEVMDIYRKKPVDVFINTSSSEGISVAIMEAQSCGIPVVATAVGGTPEIVSNENGRLISADPKPIEIAEAISDILDDPERVKEMRKASRLNWELKYNAKNNFYDFAKRLKQIAVGDQS